MKRSLWVTLACTLLITTQLRAEVGAIIEAVPAATTQRSLDKNRQKKDDTFIAAIARRMNVENAPLQKLWNRGYGRNEIITLLLISERGRLPLVDVVKERDKGTRFSTLCARCGIDHTALLTDTAALRRQIDAALAQAPDVITSTDTEKQP